MELPTYVEKEVVLLVWSCKISREPSEWLSGSFPQGKDKGKECTVFGKGNWHLTWLLQLWALGFSHWGAHTWWMQSCSSEAEPSRAPVSKWDVRAATILGKRSPLINFSLELAACHKSTWVWLPVTRTAAGRSSGLLLPQKRAPVSVGKDRAAVNFWLGICSHLASLERVFQKGLFSEAVLEVGQRQKEKFCFPFLFGEPLKSACGASRMCQMKGCTSGWVWKSQGYSWGTRSESSLVSSRWSGIALKAVALSSLQGIWTQLSKTAFPGVSDWQMFCVPL